CQSCDRHWRPAQHPVWAQVSLLALFAIAPSSRAGSQLRLSLSLNLEPPIRSSLQEHRFAKVCSLIPAECTVNSKRASARRSGSHPFCKAFELKSVSTAHCHLTGESLMKTRHSFALALLALGLSVTLHASNAPKSASAAPQRAIKADTGGHGTYEG